MSKINQNIIYGAVILLLAGLIVWLSASGERGENEILSVSASALDAVEESFDFGVVSMKDGNVSHQFELKNKGEEPVKISKAYTSCMCTTAYIIDNAGKRHGKFGMQGHRDVLSTADIKIGAGESVMVETIFDPAAHGPNGVGKIKRTVHIETNSQDHPEIQLTFSADVIN